jgi:hypothetical protein
VIWSSILLSLAAVPSASLQEQDALAQAAPEARAVWQRLLAATAGASAQPISAFRLAADVLTRSGAQTNELDIDYRYLAPDCIRFVLPSRLETGCSGNGREDYWLKDKEEVVVLAGRDYVQDRRRVDEMLALARNYVALSDPKRLSLRELRLLDRPPSDLPRSLAAAGKRLTWIAVTSPDFALVRRDGAPPPEGTVYTVDLGLSADALPHLAVIREGARGGQALLVELGKYEEKSGFRIPLQLRVYMPRAASPAAFGDAPSQEIYVTQADLRAALKREDFRP